MHKFVVLVDGNLKTYTRIEDIPHTFDNLIEFCPEMPPAPHSEDEHEEVHRWNTILHELLKREKC